MTFLTPLEMFFRWEEHMPEETFLRQPIDGEYHDYTWKEVGDQARRVAAYIHHLNLPPFTKIGILSENCAHWVISDLAIMMAKHISVPLFPNMSAKALGMTLQHSDIELLFIGKLGDYERRRQGIPAGLPCIAFPFHGPTKVSQDWDSIIEDFEPLSGSITVDAGTPATIVYTAGTGDRPKGAMHDYYNLTFVSDHYKRMLAIQPGDRLISHLSMAQMGERVLVELQAIYCGASITFLEEPGGIFQALRKVRPTLFGSLPHQWEEIKTQILDKVGALPLRLALNTPLVKQLVRRRLLRRIGLDKTTLFVTGGAMMDPNTKSWFERLGIHLHEIYAMTENTCYSHGTLESPAPLESVGSALPEVDVKLSSDGEVLVRHEGMMRGYYKESELTLEAFTSDGFLRTGDKGRIDKNGYLVLLGRVDEALSTQAGTLLPSTIERKVSKHQLIDQVCVIGADEDQRIALTVLMKDASSKPQASVSKELEKIFEKVNNTLEPIERVSKMVVMREPMTVENGLLTPTLKIKRGAVEKAFEDQRIMWQNTDNNVIWAEERAGS